MPSHTGTKGLILGHVPDMYRFHPTLGAENCVPQKMHGATTHPLFYPVECRTNDGGWETYVHDLNFPSDLDRFPPSPPPAPSHPSPVQRHETRQITPQDQRANRLSKFSEVTPQRGCERGAERDLDAKPDAERRRERREDRRGGAHRHFAVLRRHEHRKKTAAPKDREHDGVTEEGRTARRCRDPV